MLPCCVLTIAGLLLTISTAVRCRVLQSSSCREVARFNESIGLQTSTSFPPRSRNIRPDPESPHHDPPLQCGRAQDPQQLQSQRQQVIIARAASVTTNKSSCYQVLIYLFIEGYLMVIYVLVQYIFHHLQNCKILCISNIGMCF